MKSYQNFLLDISSYFDKVFLIAGNHEYHNNTKLEIINQKIENICAQRNNLFFLNRKSHLINSDENIYISGCTLWAKQPFSKRFHHEKDTKWLFDEISLNKEKYFVIATHHCPYHLCIPYKYSDKSSNYFYSNQTKILKNENVLMWIHGHTHYNRDFNVHDTWVLSNQYGYFQHPNKNYFK